MRGVLWGSPIIEKVNQGEAKRMNETTETNELIGIDEEIINLPTPDREGDVSVEKALWARKSVRRFLPRELTVKQISQILWAAKGINRPGKNQRTCPSAGGAYPLITYIAMGKGVYRYYPDGHRLRRIIREDKRKEISVAALEQEWVEKAPISIIITAIYERTTARYGKRGEMYVHMEAGHAAQNVHLQAAALGLGSVPVGAFIDARIAKIIKCTEQEIPIYIIPVGYEKG